MKPKGLIETTIIMCIFNVCGFVYLDSSMGHLAIQIIIGLLIVGISYIILWYYWRGKNWARILVIITSIIALLNLFDLANQNVIQQILTLSEAVLACYLLYWLNTRKVKLYFSYQTD
jgi:hypothetical protein